MLSIYATCGEWISNEGWSFSVDEDKGARLLALESTTTIDELKNMVAEDYGIVQQNFMIECSYVPQDLVNNLGSLPVIISNDRQVKKFVAYVTNQASTQLCVMFKPKAADFRVLVPEIIEPEVEAKEHVANGDTDDDLEAELVKKDAGRVVRLSLDNVVTKGQRFDSKTVLKATMEMCAMKYNFDYMVYKFNNEWWNIRCSIDICNWRLRARCLSGSTFFKITKYVSNHTCAPLSKTNRGKIASARTIATLIMPKYHGVKEGPKLIDVVQFMRSEHGVEISYSLAFDAREYAVNAVRGIPEKSYAKIPKYLYMLKRANLGTHYDFETDVDGRFKYLFLAFGQCIREFHKTIRRVVVVDGTFLKNK